MNKQSNNSSEALHDRLKREARFHDDKYSGGDLYPRHYSVGPTQHVYQEMLQMIGDIQGKSVLEYGCGEGWITLDLAQRGARVSAFDVSSRAIDNTREVLLNEGLLEQCDLTVMPAEELSYPDNSFDIALGFAIIHHLDLVSAIAELYRVLKPGGIAYFAEPLATNPAISLYRWMTPQYRTEDERPLILSELPDLFIRFTAHEHREFYLTALAAVALVYLPGGARLFPVASKVFHRLDRAILNIVPSAGKWAWYSVIKVIK